jgi:hypothetical protein
MPATVETGSEYICTLTPFSSSLPLIRRNGHPIRPTAKPAHGS